MSNMFLGDLPALIVLDPPGRPMIAGNRRYRCMVCTNMFPITETSYKTIKQLRAEHRMYVVVCYDCHHDVAPVMRTDETIEAGQNAARRILGLR